MDNENTRSLQQAWMVIKRGRNFILSVVTLVTLAAVILNYWLIPPTYETWTSVIIGQGEGANNGRMQYDAIMMYQKLTRTYMEIAHSQRVLIKTIQGIGGHISVRRMQQMMSIEILEGTQILIIKAQSRDPGLVYRMATVYTNCFIEESQRVYPVAKITVMDRAEIPQKPVRPNKMLNIVSAFLLGIIASVWAVFIKDSLAHTFWTSKDIENYLQIPVIGVIPWEG